MKTSHFVTSSLAALAVVGSVGLAFAQSTAPGMTTQDSTTTTTTTTPMATTPAGSATVTTPATTDSVNNNASMNEPVARADRN